MKNLADMFTKAFTEEVFNMLIELKQFCAHFPQTPTREKMDYQRLVSEYVRKIDSSITNESLRKSDTCQNQLKTVKENYQILERNYKTTFSASCRKNGLFAK